MNHHKMIAALVEEIRRLRSELEEVGNYADQAAQAADSRAYEAEQRACRAVQDARRVERQVDYAEVARRDEVQKLASELEWLDRIGDRFGQRNEIVRKLRRM